MANIRSSSGYAPLYVLLDPISLLSRWDVNQGALASSLGTDGGRESCYMVQFYEQETSKSQTLQDGSGFSCLITFLVTIDIPLSKLQSYD